MFKVNIHVVRFLKIYKGPKETRCYLKSLNINRGKKIFRKVVNNVFHYWFKPKLDGLNDQIS